MSGFAPRGMLAELFNRDFVRLQWRLASSTKANNQQLVVDYCKHSPIRKSLLRFEKQLTKREARHRIFWSEWKLLRVVPRPLNAALESVTPTACTVARAFFDVAEDAEEVSLGSRENPYSERH